MKQTRVGVSIILINENNEILAGKRKGSHGEGLWSIPGGHIEFGETYKQTCDRELWEEIGCDLSDYEYEKIGFSEDFFEKFNGGPNYPHSLDKIELKHYTTLYFVVKVPNNLDIKNMEPDKCEGWFWFDLYNLPSEMFCDSYNQIKTYFETKKIKKGDSFACPECGKEIQHGFSFKAMKKMHNSKIFKNK
jgi:8-oxo-dGTP diphosphatase